MGGCCVSRDGKGQYNFTQQDYLRIRQDYEKAGQGHIFVNYELMDPISQQQLLYQCTQINPLEVNTLFSDLVKNTKELNPAKKEEDILEQVEQNLVNSKLDMTLEMIEEFTNIGLKKIRQGKVALVILAGGQGTRLGFDHPKGMYDIKLPSHKSIFQILVERYIRIQMIAHEAQFPTPLVQQCKLIIMTSQINHDETVEFFAKNNYFQARKDHIIFFQQSVLPAVDNEGKILMEDSGKISLSPNGNGAIFDSIKKQPEVLKVLKKAEYVQIIGVDNVINKILDPLYIGFAVKNDLQAAMKSCIKRDWKEPVGVVVKKNSKYDIVEYSELTEEQAKAQDDKGQLKFNLGNILIFILKTDKLLQLCENSQSLNQLYHKAFKKVSYWDNSKKEVVKPEKPNAYKFELFIHNFLPFCEPGKFGVLIVPREEEFAPVKNAEDEAQDSPNTARELIFNLHKKWLIHNGGKLDSSDKNEFEIDFLLSYDGENIKSLVEGQTFKPPHYLHSRAHY